MIFGYNTNGFPHHDLFDAVELIAEIGFRAVGITIDHGPISPRNPQRFDNLEKLKTLLTRLGMRTVVETGARFLLNSREKHEPTLVSEDAAPRLEFYRYAIDCAKLLGSDCVSIWSGVLREPISKAEAWLRLEENLRRTLDYAAEQGALVGFEPEPGMLVETTAGFHELRRRLNHPNLRLTLDVGHLHCMGETPLEGTISENIPYLINVHIEDMLRGVHEHLPFGEGEIDFPPVLKALDESAYTGAAYVELSRSGHDAPSAAKNAWAFLNNIPSALAGRRTTGKASYDAN